MLFSGLEILGRRSKLKFLDHAFLYSGEGIVAFNISLRSTKFVTRSTFIAVACVCFVLIPVSKHNAPCYAKIENDLRYTQQTSYNTTFTETETGTDVTATGERP